MGCSFVSECPEPMAGFLVVGERGSTVRR